MSRRCLGRDSGDDPRRKWLAIAGGAHGLGFFPPDWGVGIPGVIRGIADGVRRLEPALLQPAVPVDVSPATHGGARIRTRARRCGLRDRGQCRHNGRRGPADGAVTRQPHA